MPKKKDEDVRQLTLIVDQIVETRRDRRGVHPSWVATEAMVKLDPRRWVQRKHPLIYKAAHLELRQIAREKCRLKWMPDDDESDAALEKHPLFPELQWRYPVARSKGEDSEYVLLEELADTDVAFNVRRLRCSAVAHTRHADALEAWGRDRPKRASPESA